LKFLFVSLTNWIWMISETNKVIVINKRLSLLLGNTQWFSIHSDVETKISSSWIFVLLLIILFFLGYAEGFTIHANIETEIAIWIIITFLSHYISTSLKFLFTGLTNWIWMISEINKVIIINIGLSLLLSNTQWFSIHSDIETKISSSWVFILLLIILFFLSDAIWFAIHADIETKITIWIIITLLS
jgi:hypothetical protein